MPSCNVPATAHWQLNPSHRTRLSCSVWFYLLVGIGWAMILSPIYGSVVFAGLFIDVFIYTLWLKRRTCMVDHPGWHLGRHACPGWTHDGNGENRLDWRYS